MTNTQWKLCRLLMNMLATFWFLALAFYVGPNEILYHKMTRLAPSDFVSLVEVKCVPVVRAMKMYEREHGKLPETADDIKPFIKDLGVGNMEGEHDIRWGSYTYYVEYMHQIKYDFTPGQEGWSISGKVANGPIAAPPVVLEQTARP